jgi:hypothetical protein
MYGVDLCHAGESPRVSNNQKGYGMEAYYARKDMKIVVIE